MELICLCRCGFEKEAAVELQEKAALLGLAGYVKTGQGGGMLRFVCHSHEDAQALVRGTPFDDLIFVRHWFVLQKEVHFDNNRDRVTPLLRSCPADEAYASLATVEIDTNEGKSLARLTRSIAGHLRRRLDKAAYWLEDGTEQLQLLFVSASHALLGSVPRERVSRWESGIPRLRLPKGAPSRASLKLEEAWLHFLAPEVRERFLTPGMRAVDLGAAPGGWTWQLVQNSLFVDAVDNGPMQQDLLDSGQVVQHRLDGFRYQPAKPVDWLVCDIADKPLRVAGLIGKWARNGWCRMAIFNLKLPMKRRYAAVMEAQALIAEQISEQPYRMKFKQLYHDREEVTGFLDLSPHGHSQRSSVISR